MHNRALVQIFVGKLTVIDKGSTNYAATACAAVIAEAVSVKGSVFTRFASYILIKYVVFIVSGKNNGSIGIHIAQTTCRCASTTLTILSRKTTVCSYARTGEELVDFRE